jgi:hypothetical protein
MNRLVTSNYKYWIVSFSLEDAHIIEANTSDDIVRNPKTTFKVLYRDLRYRYVDIDKEAKTELANRRMRPDPRVLADQKINVNDLLVSLQSKGSTIDIESLKQNLELAQLLANFDPEGFQEKIKEYEMTKRQSDEELLESIYTELKQKRNYTPQIIQNFTLGGLLFGLPQAGYIVGKKAYQTLEDSLDSLYYAWEGIRTSPEKVLFIRRLENLSSKEAQRRLLLTFSEIFT